MTPSAPEDLIPRAEDALDQVGIDPPQLEPVLGVAHDSTRQDEPALEDEPETPLVPRARAVDGASHTQDTTVLEHH